MRLVSTISFLLFFFNSVFPNYLNSKSYIFILNPTTSPRFFDGRIKLLNNFFINALIENLSLYLTINMFVFCYILISLKYFIFLAQCTVFVRFDTDLSSHRRFKYCTFHGIRPYSDIPFIFSLLLDNPIPFCIGNFHFIITLIPFLNFSKIFALFSSKRKWFTHLFVLTSLNNLSSP